MKKRGIKVLTGVLGFGIVFCAAIGALALKVSAETEYEYDDLNRLTEERHDDGTVIYYSYDANGNLLDVEVKDGNDAENKDPNESSGENPGGNQNGNAGGQGGESLGSNEKHDRKNNPESSGNGGTYSTENGQESAAENGRENNGLNQTEDVSKGTQEGTGGNGSESGIGQEEAEGEEDISENGGSRTVSAKVLPALIVPIAALSGGFFVWKKKKTTENKDK